MFANDTTVYLDASDSFDELQCVLNKWCQASSAKFNVEKTEVIPIGTPEYRAQVIETRKLNANDSAMPASVHIAKEGESVRILGGHMGNGIDASTLWTPVLEKIDSALERWERDHPTLEARKNIIQITVAAMTQYLTQMNGMPEKIVTHLLRAQREFMWGGAKSLL
jgi:hypothetical protein